MGREKGKDCEKPRSNFAGILLFWKVQKGGREKGKNCAKPRSNFAGISLFRKKHKGGREKGEQLKERKETIKDGKNKLKEKRLEGRGAENK